MEWDHDIDLLSRKMSTRLIIQRALARGWRVCGFTTAKPLLLLYVPGRERPISLYSASPPQMSYPAVKIAKDKFATNAVLNAALLPVPAEILVQVDGRDSDKAAEFIATHGRVVLKPLDASHGKGITVNIDTSDAYSKALETARPHTKKRNLVLQEQLAGIDVRILCIGYEYADAISRQPASVVGDGRHSIVELVRLTNQSEDRGENYSARLNIIPLEMVESYLGADALRRIPESGEHVQVIGVSNVGMGGIRKNIRSQIPEELKKIAVAAARELNLPVCGVDFMVKCEPHATNTLAELDPKIIEVNECPMLTMYEDLESPEQLALIDRYLDYVSDMS